MKALFIGLGSIGTRHLNNLNAKCKELNIELEVSALRSSTRKLPPETAILVHKELSVLPQNANYDLAFITNPTNLHAIVLGGLVNKVDTFFIEKPIFEHANYLLGELGLGIHQKAYVAAPMRWCGVYLALRKKLEDLPIYSARAICSSYLPSWRPKADYREIYSAKREMGGGVTLDLIHEWDYLIDLFGMPLASHNFKGQFSNLEIDSDDLSIYIAQYSGFLCELHLDYFGRSYRRDIEIFTEEGSLCADFGTGMLSLPSGETEDYAEPVNSRYEREMEYFLRYAAQNEQIESINSPKKAIDVLKLTLGEYIFG